MTEDLVEISGRKYSRYWWDQLAKTICMARSNYDEHKPNHEDSTSAIAVLHALMNWGWKPPKRKLK